MNSSDIAVNKMDKVHAVSLTTEEISPKTCVYQQSQFLPYNHAGYVLKFIIKPVINSLPRDTNLKAQQTACRH